MAYEIYAFFVRLAARILFDLRIHGLEHLPASGGVVVAANHKSFWDPPIIALVISHVRKAYFMAKSELFRNLVFDAFMRFNGARPLKRGANDIGAVRAALDLLNKGETLVVFPEGTRRVEGSLTNFLSGVGFLAAKAKAPIVPAYLSDFVSFPRFRQKVSISFGHPIYPKGKDIKQEKDALTQQTLNAIRELSHE
ncbi:lysophospholipid acyltransferase family protein [Elusimicrobiota bacterium]